MSSSQHHSLPGVPTGAFNATEDLLFAELTPERSRKCAVRDRDSETTYGELGSRVRRLAAGLRRAGVAPEQRILLCLLDTVDFPVAFLGAIYAGIVPVPVNTLLTSRDYDFMLSNSRARLAIISASLLPVFEPILAAHPELTIVVSGASDGASLAPGALDFEHLLDGPEMPRAAATDADEPAFWLYSSGSTGMPKGTVHAHSSLRMTAELYAKPILGIREDDVVFSAAKLFFAYGLGNNLTFPFSVGATAVLLADRPTPAAVARLIVEQQPTVFCGVPTLFNALLAAPELPARAEQRMRVCTSAGEALPAETGRRWSTHFGVEILDGLGSTEMLHIFLSNRPGAVRYGTTGHPVPGYEVRLVDEAGACVPENEIGELQVRGPTSAMAYWNNRERSRDTFMGHWTRSGDKYFQDQDGYFVYCGRTDDMLKVGGIYVAPFEVEAVLAEHPKVLEVAVVGHPDEAGLVKPKAFIVLRAGLAANAELAGELQQFVKDRLAPYKYPRWIEFLDELPKTATGKIQRFKLRAAAQAS